MDDAEIGEQRVGGPVAEARDRVASDTGFPITLPTLLMGLWLAGGGVLGTVVFVKSCRFWAMLKQSANEADPALVRIADNLSWRLGLRRKVHVVVLAKPFVPAVFGWWQPTIVLPEALLAAKSGKDIEPIGLFLGRPVWLIEHDFSTRPLRNPASFM